MDPEHGSNADLVCNVPKTSVEILGRQQVGITKPVGASNWAMVAITITASGKMLDKLVIFKGSAGEKGQICKKFAHYKNKNDANGIYTVQANAWMDEAAMSLWVTQVLKPYVKKAPRQVTPVLLLDSYWCHVMEPIVAQIEALGVVIKHLPAGCTPICQPLKF